jgi:hypothetical protein
MSWQHVAASNACINGATKSARSERSATCLARKVWMLATLGAMAMR